MKTKLKKLILLFVVVCITSTALAQDRIIKKDKSEIKAKILELTDNEIKYKKEDNLEGPTYSIKKSEVNAIIYKNGQVETFTETTPTSIPKQNVQTNEKTTKPSIQTETSRGSSPYSRAEGKGKKILFYDNKNNMVLKTQNMREIGEIMESFPQLKGQIKQIKTLRLVRGGIEVLGLGGLFLGYFQMKKYLDNSSLNDPIFKMNSGFGIYIASLIIPPIIKFGIIFPKTKKLASDFTGLVKQNKTSLNLKLNPNGIGLALNF